MQLVIINYQPGDVIMVASLAEVCSGVWNEEDWNKAYSDDLRLRMAETFLYQEENASTISEQKARGLNRLVLIACNDFL